jgi:hypothetical protein
MKAFMISILKSLFIDILKEVYEWAQFKIKQKRRSKEVKDAIKSEDRQEAAKGINDIFNNK